MGVHTPAPDTGSALLGIPGVHAAQVNFAGHMGRRMSGSG